MTTKPATALPRPYVVCDVLADPARSGRTKLVYAVMNEDRGFDFPRVRPRALVVLDEDLEVVGRDRKGRPKLAAKVRVLVVDRATGAIGTARAARPDDVRGILDALPDAP